MGTPRRERSPRGKIRRRVLGLAAEPGFEEACRSTTSCSAAWARGGRGPRGHALLRLYCMMRPCRPVPVALEREGIALRTGPRASTASMAARSSSSRASSKHIEIRRAGARRSGRRRWHLPPAGRSSTHRVATAVRLTPCRAPIARKRASRFLEQGPAAEIVDDELVLGQRAVGEGLLRLRDCRASARTESRRRPCRSTEASCRAPGTSVTRPFSGRSIEQRVLHLHRDERHAGVEQALACAACRSWCRRSGGSCPRAEAPSSHSAVSTAPGTA